MSHQSIMRKHCNKCGRTKPVTDFGKKRSERDGLNCHCKACRNAYSRTHNRSPARQKYIHSEEYRLRKREEHLLKHYGITLRDFEAIFERQGRRCAICRRPDPATDKNWHIDHDHRRNKIRGILCFNCNRTLGQCGDTLEGIARFVRYLEAAERDGAQLAS